MKRLDRYVMVSYLWAFIVATIFFAGMYLMIHFFNKLGSLDRVSATFREYGYSPLEGLARYYGANLPFILVETAPFTILMAGMWAVQQMARRNELVPILGAGVSLRRLALPIILLSFAIVLLYSGVRERVLPDLATERHRMERLYRGNEEQVIKKLRQLRDSKGYLVHVDEYEIDRQEARGVYVLPPDWDLLRDAHGSAESLRYANGRWEPTTANADPVIARFVAETDLTATDLEIEARSLRFLDVQSLRTLVDRFPERSDLRVLLHSHFAYPLGAMVLLFLGLPLVMRTGRRSPFVAAGISLLLSVAFFATQTVLSDLGSRDEVINPVLGVWLPIVIFGSAGLILFELMPT
ncbi:MAG TPA: LptF/LptG family permease [Planctomycetota bacterium]|nr:LptF/LptG family permease [Planctomycetota bacterium]